MRLPQVNKYVGMLLIAVFLALVSVTLIVRYLHQTRSQYQAELQEKLSQGTVQVVVPSTDLPPGTVASDQNMSIRQFPKDLLYQDTILVKDWPQFSGRALRRPVSAGKPLLSSYFDKLEVSDFASLLPPGTRAVTISVDEVNALAGLLRPGDHIDILLATTRTGEDGVESQDILPVLNRVLVLATGNDLGFSEGMPKPGQNLAGQFGTVTLQLTADQASELMLAHQLGTLRIALTPGFEPPAGAPDMPRQNSIDLLAKLAGSEARRAQGIGPVQFIIGTGSEVTQQVMYSGTAPAAAKPQAEPPKPLPPYQAQEGAKELLRALLQGNSPAPAADGSGVPTGH
ncbi:MAG: Flp pilus assembly protein CpaB [Proteobacteria bacterium]|nr:Flp pilus assembly protein CpaB [Pseudomonadota bacterium]